MKISVVFPVKNQTAKLLKNIRERALPYYDSLGIAYDFLIVYDGSDLENKNLMEEEAKTLPLQVKLVPYEDHKGKGHNVQKGFLAATGDYVMFMDADLATDLESIKKILPEIDKYDGFVASRHCKDAKIATPQTFIRRLTSLASRLLIKMKFHFKGLSDTQCGYKLFRTDLAKAMAEHQIIDGFAFDVEYLYFMKLNGFSVKEIPVIWTDDANSTISHPFQAGIAFNKEMRQIKKNKKNYLLSEA
ncbi:MAG: glycosyltransferase, partial [Bacilli bacterium]|nr:glycosyltransferase [Bacilli bacterium]